ncbi:MAG: hypothetical protein ACOX2F_00770 [bacterium]
MFVFPGSNSNISHRGKKYHVQTEVNKVNGLSKINTLVYLAGTICFSLSSEMNKDDLFNRESAENAAEKQHNKVIRDLISDQLTSQKETEEAGAINFGKMYEDPLYSCNLKSELSVREIFKTLITSKKQ